jgi:hypothetical protein
MSKKLKIIDNSESTIQMNKILENILDMSSKILNEQNKIYDKILELENRIIKIEELSIKYNINEDIKELKREDLVIDKEYVIKSLLYRDHRSIICIFKNIYKNNMYPIKMKKSRTFEYYCNNKWNIDLYGHYSMNVLFSNIQNLFIKNNNVDEFDDEDFILNQTFIYKLSDDKFKKSIFKYIVDEISCIN